MAQLSLQAQCALLCGRDDWQVVLSAHQDLSPQQFALKARLPAALDQPALRTALAEQLHCYPLAAAKFPRTHQLGMIYTRTALAQASHGALWHWRQQLAQQAPLPGGQRADLTGGLGMDSWMLAVPGAHLNYVEQDADLARIAAHNHALLGAASISHHQSTAEQWLQRAPPLTQIFLDPARRDDQGKRLLRLEDCEPNVLALLPQLRRAAPEVLVKLSPALDLSLAMRQLQPSRISVVSLDGEVKELLAHCGSTPVSEAHIDALLLDKQGAERYRLAAPWPMRTDAPVAVAWQEYLFEPDPALIKAQLVPQLASAQELSMLRAELVYLTGAAPDDSFPGRVYRIQAVIPWQRKQVQRHLKHQGISRVQIHRRDFPLAPAQLYQQLGLAAGDQADLFFTRTTQAEVLICQRLF